MIGRAGESDFCTLREATAAMQSLRCRFPPQSAQPLPNLRQFRQLLAQSRQFAQETLHQFMLGGRQFSIEIGGQQFFGYRQGHGNNVQSECRGRVTIAMAIYPVDGVRLSFSFSSCRAR